MQILIFDVNEQKKCECEHAFKEKILSSGKNDDGLYDLVFKDATIHGILHDGIAIHDRHSIVYFNNCDYSIIKIL